jgi:hypothetical protein
VHSLSSFTTHYLVLYFISFFHLTFVTGKPCLRPQGLTEVNHLKSIRTDENVLMSEFEGFKTRHGKEYGYENWQDPSLKALRENFPSLQGRIYLDFTGAGVHSATQLSGFLEEITQRVYGNTRVPAFLFSTSFPFSLQTLLLLAVRRQRIGCRLCVILC